MEAAKVRSLRAPLPSGPFLPHVWATSHSKTDLLNLGAVIF
jgi:hypothetical protein